MSYAEQLFGGKEAQIREYSNNLAWFGEDSYVYQNYGMMEQILNSATGLLNPVANEYVARWISEKNYKVPHLIGGREFTISIYNSDLERAIYFVPIKQLDDGSIVYVSDKEYAPYVLAQGSGTVAVGADILDYLDYKGVVYLNSRKIDWKNDYTGNSKAGQSDWSQRSFSGLIAMRPGFLHGLSRDTLNNLKPVDPTNSTTLLCLPLIETYLTELANYASRNPDFFSLSKDAYNDYSSFRTDYNSYDINNDTFSQITRKFAGEIKPWLPVINKLSAGTVLSNSGFRATIRNSTSDNYSTMTEVQASQEPNTIAASIIAVPASKHIMLRI